LPHVVVPLSILVVPGVKPMVLSQDPELITKMESGGDMDPGILAKQMPFDHAGYTVLFRGVTNYQAKRQMYDCLAIKLNGTGSAPDKPKS
ncbi:MAG TPA: hypothetical protein VFB72_15485, partial [Verrucomicrobiae bacterium]|nr:hypothetical protein [Verrucomicrobiae bacterium]